MAVLRRKGGTQSGPTTSPARIDPSRSSVDEGGADADPGFVADRGTSVFTPKSERRIFVVALKPAV